MGRLPFNPKKMTGTPAPEAAARSPEASAPTADRVLSVSDLAALIDGALKSGLDSPLRVVGEVSGFNDRTHWYFTLKDADAVVSAVMFASSVAKCRFRVANGQRVVASGRVEFFGKQGRTQFYVTSLEPVGMGELELRLRALIEELRGLGWLDADRKRPLPRFPRRVAVVTSKTGAALQDVLDTMRRRCPAVEVIVCDVRVQGEGSAEEIAAMLTRLSQRSAELGLDAVILTRGGGSIEDLWSFNERVVAEAVLKCSVPVVAAIGHETDTTLAELVADERAATPTQAAMRLTPDRAALSEQLQQLSARSLLAARRLVTQEQRRVDAAARHPAVCEPGYVLGSASQRHALALQRLRSAAGARVSSRRAALERLGARLARHEPRGLYAGRRAALAHAEARLARAVRARLDGSRLDELLQALGGGWDAATERRAAALSALERELLVVGPMSVLARGYSITTRASDGAVVRSAASLRTGESIETRLADGKVRSKVVPEEGSPGPESGASSADAALQRLPAPTPMPERRPARAVGKGRRGGKRGDSRDQMGLF
ncbi:MAG: exodeoxyribonuclease VII large subunit [Phycisphaerales bacterium]